MKYEERRYSRKVVVVYAFAIDQLYRKLHCLTSGITRKRFNREASYQCNAIPGNEVVGSRSKIGTSCDCYGFMLIENGGTDDINTKDHLCFLSLNL